MYKINDIGSKYLFTLILFLPFFSVKGQNLVPNSSFELYGTCPTNLSQTSALTSWFHVSGHLGTPDYFNACYVSGTAALSPSVPVNGFGNQAAFSGSAYAGFYSYCTNPVTNPNWDYREYLTVPLISPLIAGVSYTFGFYVSPAENHKYGSDGVGAYLSVGPIGATSGNFQPLSYTPQISNPSGNIITNTSIWTIVSGTFVASGGEDHLTIGNFRSNVNTSVQLINATPMLGLQNSYFYLDDAFVEQSSVQIFGNDLCLGDSVTLQATGGTQFAWADSLAPSVILSDSSFLTVAPLITTTYLVYGANDTASYTVHVSATGNYPIVDLGNDTTLCVGETLLLDISGSNYSYVWQDTSSNPTFNVVQAGTYWVTATVDYCTASDTIVVNYNTYPVLDLGNDSTLCFGDTLLLDASAPNTSYLWQDNSTNSTFSVTQNGLYFVTSTENNCSVHDTISINYIPQMTLDLGPDLTLCEGQTLTLDVTSISASYVWQNGSTSPQFQIIQAGQYFVEVTNSCEILNDTIQVSYFYPPSNYLGNDTTACLGSTITLNVNVSGSQTHWQDQSVGNSFLVNETGTYTATSVSQEGCAFTDQININFITIPEVNLGPDKRICDIKHYALSNLANAQGSYIWNTGSTNDYILLDSVGTYFVHVSNQCGAAYDTIVLNQDGCNCEVYIPNSFTPNHDEVNRLFGAKYDCTFNQFNLKIFNRWGELIWESSDPDIHWDGTYQNKTVKDGTYTYKLNYSIEFVLDKVLVGHVVVMQ